TYFFRCPSEIVRYSSFTLLLHPTTKVFAITHQRGTIPGMPHKTQPPAETVLLDFEENELFRILAAAERLDISFDCYIRRCTDALYEKHRPLPSSALPCEISVQAIA